MNIYEQKLKQIVRQKFDNEEVDQIIDTLFKLGVVDYSLCKILCIRSWVDKMCLQGLGRIDAMWMATEKFACTFEYVRKCIYYYKNVSID